MENINKRIEFYIKIRDYINDQIAKHDMEVTYYRYLYLHIGSKWFAVVKHGISSRTLKIINSYVENKVCILNNKQEKIVSK